MLGLPTEPTRDDVMPYHEFYLDDFEPRAALPAALGAHPADRAERPRLEGARGQPGAARRKA